MATLELPAAKAILLAVRLASNSDIETFHILVSRYPKTLNRDIVLRILLTNLSESVPSSQYVPLLQEFQTGDNVQDSEPERALDASVLDTLSNAEASKQVKKLHLLPLLWPDAPPDAPTDSLIQFLIHRSIRIDSNTGILTQLPTLLTPFLSSSEYLQMWATSTILPLLRLNYEYYFDGDTTISIPAFDQLSDRRAIRLLLSKTNKETAGRDLRGLVGPWLYGDLRWKRRKLTHKISSRNEGAVEPELTAEPKASAGWEVAFEWLTTVGWVTGVEAIEQWDGPGDVDLGGYTHEPWLRDDEQQHLETRFARAALATVYLIPEASVEAMHGAQRILYRISSLLDLESVPTLRVAAETLAPISSLDEHGILSPKNGLHLRNNLLHESNILTKPDEISITFLSALTLSAFLLTRAGHPLTLRRAGELVLLGDEREQRIEFMKLMVAVINGPKGDDKYWINARNEIIWLHSWSAKVSQKSVGIFGTLSREFIEAEILKALLANTRYTLAQSIYENGPEQVLPGQRLHDTIVTAAMNAYDNATNANKSRGGVKKCQDILKAFPDTLKVSRQREQMTALINVTNAIGQYRLVFKQGEPFTPVILRVHGDPISIIDKLLSQNPKSYSKVNDFIHIGKDMVRAGLTTKGTNGPTVLIDTQMIEQDHIVEKRVVSMCIDAALAEDDFETAYSFVVTRLKDIAERAHARTPDLESTVSGLFAEPAPRQIDDWSWRAALQAGKYRRTAKTIKPTHLGNASGNLDIRHLEQRMECLSQALRLAPKNTLQDILNVYRRCEEELDSQVEQEAQQEASWDMQSTAHAIPGGFSAKSSGNTSHGRTPSRSLEEEPMSLFDLSRASMARAQSGLSALSMLRANKPESSSSTRNQDIDSVSSNEAAQREPVRKRDQLKNAAVTSLASGIGWLINAPPLGEEDHNEV